MEPIYTLLTLNNFNYAQRWESQIVDEIETYKTYESIITAEENIQERRVKERFRKFLNDGGMVA